MKSQISNLKSQTPILAVIMARKGSIGLPGKALIPLLDRPVIAYTFDHAKESKRITRTIVSSDDPAILLLAKKENLEPLPRPPELATATSATDPVLRHALRTLYQSDISNLNSQILPYAVVMLYGNIPIRAGNMIDRCIDLLLDTGCDSVQTISTVGKFHPYWMFNRNDTGQIQKHVPNNVFRRQDLPPLYSPTGAVYAIKSTTLLAAEGNPDPHAFLGQDRRGFITAPEDSVDIDSQKDLYLAEAILRAQTEATTFSREPEGERSAAVAAPRM